MPNRKHELIEMIMKMATPVWQRSIMGQSNYEQDKAAYMRYIKQLEEIGAVVPKAVMFGFWGVLEMVHARYTVALDKMQEALELLRQYGNEKTLEYQMAIMNNIGEVYRIVGNYERAVEQYQRVVEFMADNNLRDNPTASIFYSNLGAVQMMLGNLDAAEAALELAIQRYQGKRWDHQMGIIESWRVLADVRLLRGNVAGAWDALKVAQSSSEIKDRDLLAAKAHLTATHIIAHDSPNDESIEGHIEAAERHIANIKTPSAQAVVWLEEAYYQRLYGTPEAAARFAAKARAIFESYAMVEGIAISARV